MINFCCLLMFILCKGKSRSLVCISSKQKISWLSKNPQLFCQQIDKKKYPMLKRTAKNDFSQHIFCSYKNSCFSELVHNSIVLVLMLCSYKDAHKDLTIDLGGTFSFTFSFNTFCIQFWVAILTSVLAICTYIRNLSKKFSASPSKDVKELC